MFLQKVVADIANNKFEEFMKVYGDSLKEAHKKIPGDVCIPRGRNSKSHRKNGGGY